MEKAFSADTSGALLRLREQIVAIAADRPSDRLLSAMACGTWIYGAGNYGRRIARIMTARGLPCIGFIDRRGGDGLREIDGLPVVAPGDVSAAQAEGRCLVLGMLNPTTEAEEIWPFADSLPFRHRLWNADLPEALGPEAETMWLRSRSALLTGFDSVCALAEILADPVSVQTLLSLVLFRFSGHRCDHPPHDWRCQYLPPDLPGFDHPIVFVDGGAYTGDTATALMDQGVSLLHWLAFEPDMRNFMRLTQTASECGGLATLFPCGLSNRLHQVRFEGNLGLGSRIVDGNVDVAETTVIQCVALDDAVRGLAPDFIKLDVEGAEHAALMGMAGIVEASRPRLAVSAYHKPQDLWEVPLTLAAMLPGAHLHLRQHGANGFETVAYAIP